MSMRYYIASFFLIAVLFVPWLMYTYPEQTDYALSIARGIESQFASVILSRSPKSVAEIQARYTPSSPKKVRILLVPGHEPNYGGAEFGTLKERVLAVELAEDLEKFLSENGHYEVFVSRDTHNWSPEFEAYYKNSWNDIVSWIKEAKTETINLTSVGKFKYTVPPVTHNNVRNDVGVRLYGINKWANEHDIDITIHIHLNDHPRAKRGQPGEYSGFAIYVPESQLGNSSTTRVIADNIYNRLGRYNPPSDLAGEADGIIEESELIAVGVNNTATAASLLIEYGYIYESQFLDPTVRSRALSDLAFQTYLGLQDFFKSGNDITRAYDTLMLPRSFNQEMSKTGGNSEDIFALQTALILEGVYPPRNKGRNDCPRTGKFGLCTQAALEAFQKKHGITDESGRAGSKTLKILNQLYSVLR